jgi:hypothetical protein
MSRPLNRPVRRPVRRPVSRSASHQTHGMRLLLRTGLAGALRSFGTAAIRIGHALDAPPAPAQTAAAAGPPAHWVEVVRRRAPHLLEERADGDWGDQPVDAHELDVDTGQPAGPAASRTASATSVDTGESARGPVVRTSRLGRESPMRSMLDAVVRRIGSASMPFTRGWKPLSGRRSWPFAGNRRPRATGPAPARGGVRIGARRADRATAGAAHLVRDLIGSKVHGSNLVGGDRDDYHGREDPRVGRSSDARSPGGGSDTTPGGPGRVRQPRGAGRGERLGTWLARALHAARRATGASARQDDSRPPRPSDRHPAPTGSPRPPSTGPLLDGEAARTWSDRAGWPRLPVPEQPCPPGLFHMTPIRLAPGVPGPDRPASEQPTSEQPTSDRPTSDRPTSDRPTSDRPTSEQPTRHGPAASRHPAHDGPARDGTGARTNERRTGPPSPRPTPPPAPPPDRWPDLPDDSALWTPPVPGEPDQRIRRLDDEQRGW